MLGLIPPYREKYSFLNHKSIFMKEGSHVVCIHDYIHEDAIAMGIAFVPHPRKDEIYTILDIYRSKDMDGNPDTFVHLEEFGTDFGWKIECFREIDAPPIEELVEELETIEVLTN
jgi:hypothetical protein